MRPLMLCLHAAESNIEIINQSLQDTDFVLNHVVDTHLLTLIREQHPFDYQKEYALNIIMSLIEQQPSCILVTCTNYIVLLDQLKFETSIPILKLDELLFEQLAKVRTPIKILFTNEQTIKGTMTRLKQSCPFNLSIEAIFIPEIFEWYIKGEKQRHDKQLLSTLLNLNASEYTIAVAQLSMVSGAQAYSKLTSINVLTPITAFNENILINR